MKAWSASRIPAPDDSLESASTYGFPGSSPVTAASNTCTKPWSDNETLVGAFGPLVARFCPAGAIHSGADFQANPTGWRPAAKKLRLPSDSARRWNKCCNCLSGRRGGHRGNHARAARELLTLELLCLDDHNARCTRPRSTAT